MAGGDLMHGATRRLPRRWLRVAQSGLERKEEEEEERCELVLGAGRVKGKELKNLQRRGCNLQVGPFFC